MEDDGLGKERRAGAQLFYVLDSKLMTISVRRSVIIVGKDCDPVIQSFDASGREEGWASAGLSFSRDIFSGEGSKNIRQIETLPGGFRSALFLK